MCSSRLQVRSPAQAGISKTYFKSYSQWPCWPETVEFGVSNDANEGSVPFRVKKIPDAVVMPVGSLERLWHTEWKVQNSKNTKKMNCTLINRQETIFTVSTLEIACGYWCNYYYFFIRVYLHFVLRTRGASGLLSNTSHQSACARQYPLGRQTTSLTTSPVLSPACLFHLRWVTLFEDSCTTHGTKTAIQ